MGGVSKARNIGIAAAKGEFLHFIDSDDYLSPTHLEQYASVMEYYDIIFQGYRMFDSKTGDTVEKHSLKDMSSEFGNAMTILCKLFDSGNQFGPAWSKIFRRDIVEKRHIRFKEEISIREDEIFTFEYCQYVSAVRVLSTSTYNYRMTPNSLMRRKYIDPKEMLNAFNSSYQASLQLPLTEEFHKKIDLYYREGLMWAYWKLYFPGKLADYSFRMYYYDLLVDWDKKHPNLVTRLIKKNIRKTDYLQLLNYIRKVILQKIKLK